MAKTQTVLVVDDHDANLSGLRQLLERDNYAVLTAKNGADAIRIARNESPDVVVVDVVMPGVSGLDVCTELKTGASTRLTPVVLMSGRNERDLRIQGMAAGADDFLAKPVDIEELSVRVRSLMRLKEATDALECAEVLFATLGRVIEARDPSTEGHCARLASYAKALGTSLGLSQSDLDTLALGGFLHDIGKISIPDRVLLKKTRLTDREYNLMKRHPVVGDELCGTVRSLEPVRPLVRHHHERLDGRGYPDRLSGDKIPLLAQIITVVDVFDALTTERPYRRALSVAAARRTMRMEAQEGAYSLDLVNRFLDVHQSESATTETPRRRKPAPVPRRPPLRVHSPYAVTRVARVL
jgi:cyclic di-GMP phosphodiesterase